MINLGIIGTNWITEQFVNATDETKAFSLTHVYSRTEAKANKFIEDLQKKNIAISTDLEKFFSSDDFETVYIASPNGLHFQQAKLALEHGKNVIVEKPSTSTVREFTILDDLAHEKGLFLFEAARHIHEPIFKKIQNYVEDNRAELSGATLSYMKYSSRYDDFKAGNLPNIFNPKFSGGALYDLGVYTVYDAVVLFGQPESVNYVAEILSSGIDGSGSLTLKYPEFDVNILIGKTKNSYTDSEIYFDRKTLLMDSGGDITHVQLADDNKNITTIPTVKSENPMDSEAKEFARIMNENDQETYENLLKYARIVNRILEQARTSAGLVFGADEDK
ncbi:Gfo/Idh/MocA family protein [Companilactobacillus bobalius]|uniref:Oxidoreductase n=2 Tax=Companilactobacillus bobalius TaxID=2801451 RepID=A0A0R1KQZ9_9LACO|nr:Gfo/Idh/MocA family oxidoreductase [Companilactobacillus bobalius]KAE9561645.1 oxidoreductase [Companilactobacillus bobalius]KRK82554.1 oxidoreductase [Companilactobacillus bobalius DSM 19674]OVE98260.1 putative oxidoreductase YgjR [Companilactobacillus bobalius]GEO58821.1 oxidoreductase [Companilactobacillus paralimentarius]